MLGTYASFAAILIASGCVGQALCRVRAGGSGRGSPRRWGSRRSPRSAWATVRLPGDGTAAAIAIGVLAVASRISCRGRVAGLRPASSAAFRPSLGAVIAASLPFIVERRFGILGTGLNPDMSQHLFAADRLAHGEGSRLLAQGYPLGPHSLVVASPRRPARAWSTPSTASPLAIAACATLAPLRCWSGSRLAANARRRCSSGCRTSWPPTSSRARSRRRWRRSWCSRSRIGLHELSRRRSFAGARRARPVAVPLAVLAIGSVYSYSFPGCCGWAGPSASGRRRARGRGAAPLRRRRGAREKAASPAGVAVAVLVAGAAPEIGRMVDFASFETFNPPGPGSATSSTRSRPWRRSASGHRATSASTPETVRCRPSATTSASCSGWLPWPTGSPGGSADPSGRCRRRSRLRRSSTATLTSRAPRTRRRRRA